MRLLTTIGLLVWLTTSSAVQAGFQFQLDQQVYANLTPGQNVTSNLYVAATGATDIAAYKAAGSGLDGYSFNLSGAGSTTISGFTRALVFGGGGAIPAGTTLNQGFSFTNSGTIAPDASGRVLVGSLSFTAGAAGSTTVYSFSDPNPAPFDNVSAKLNGVTASPSLDNLGVYTSSPTATFSVTAVPEPSSMVLMGLIGVGVVVARRFRKKHQA